MQSGIVNQQRIFVSIASFCDPMLTFTIRSALEMARHPQRLSFGIVDQNVTSVESELPTGEWRNAYLHIDPHHSRGACWARAMAMTLYAGEGYFFQIDSHTLFDPDWDVTLIEALETVSAANGNDKVILSTRPFAFEIDGDGTISRKRFTVSTLKLVPKDPVLKLSDPVMKFAAYNSKEDRDLPGFQISAAFLFTRGRFVEEVPYDPYLYFHGEEQDISIRAFSRGWDIWHPNKVPLYHLYKTRADGEAPLHWDPRFEERRREKWLDLRTRAHRRLADLISGRLTGVYGIGAVKSIVDYLRLSGLQLED
ncbi:GlcNAc-transferase family protein [Rhizobium terrae]|uniref:GlcNAc-transferase family protein n=1 Tax=Rhizobium terrae TaxID=2171756 RepID=UPI000E3DCF3C|nr:GlcNAc-transferase family protein [Rhizobium terrae]